MGGKGHSRLMRDVLCRLVQIYKALNISEKVKLSMPLAQVYCNTSFQISHLGLL